MFYNLARLYFILLAILKLFLSHNARIAPSFTYTFTSKIEPKSVKSNL